MAGSSNNKHCVRLCQAYRRSRQQCSLPQPHQYDRGNFSSGRKTWQSRIVSMWQVTLLCRSCEYPRRLTFFRTCRVLCLCPNACTQVQCPRDETYQAGWHSTFQVLGCWTTNRSSPYFIATSQIVVQSGSHSLDTMQEYRRNDSVNPLPPRHS